MEVSQFRQLFLREAAGQPKLAETPPK